MLEGFLADLLQKGYAIESAREHIRKAEHLLFWLHKKAGVVSKIDVQSFEAFDRHLPRCRCARFGRSNLKGVGRGCGSNTFRNYLHHVGVLPAVAEEPTRGPILWRSFFCWMHERRGIAMATLASYRAPVVELLEDLGEDPSRFKPRALRDFVLKVGRSHSIGRTKIYVAALRMFLRFLIAEGKCDSGLDGAIPAVAYWKLTNVPRYLKAGDVERIVAACNGDTPIAVRNRAVVLLLARLGLRVGDILRLRLQDIDWEKGTIQLCGKGRHQTHLPLSQQVGNALFRYVRSVRPKTDTDAVFVQLRAPFYAFKAQRAVSDIAKEAMRRAGVKRPCRGAAHLLRHSLATSMLRQGASLQEIAVVLRHRSIDATQIYAKVDVNALRQVAQRWPTRRSC